MPQNGPLEDLPFFFAFAPVVCRFLHTYVSRGKSNSKASRRPKFQHANRALHTNVRQAKDRTCEGGRSRVRTGRKSGSPSDSNKFRSTTIQRPDSLGVVEFDTSILRSFVVSLMLLAMENKLTWLRLSGKGINNRRTKSMVERRDKPILCWQYEYILHRYSGDSTVDN